MAGDKPEASSVNDNNNNNNKHLHPAYTVTNIQTKVRTLDGNKVTYSSWVKLFEIQAKAFNVMDHINGTPSPKETEDTFVEWSRLDSLVLQWIYNTISDELLARILPSTTTTLDAWNKIKAIFMNNKNARAAALQYEFNNLTLSSCASMDAYCQKLQDLANHLDDVDHPVSESSRVLQLVRGLPKEFEVVGAMINQQNPSWETARDMLHLETQRQQAASRSTSTVLAAQSERPNNNKNRTTGYQGKNYDPNYYTNRGRGQNSRGRGRNQNHGRDRSSNNYAQNQHSWLQNNNWQHEQNLQQPHSHQQWAPPPSPYPTAPPLNLAQNQRWTNNQQQHANYIGQFGGGGGGPQISNGFGPVPQQQQPPNGPAPFSGFSGYPANFNTNDLVQAMQQVNLTSNDSNWYMDTGATSHLTYDPGSQDWSSPFPPR